MIELLSPAADFSVMKACIAAGADAIYMGLPKFSARAFAHNETEESFIEAIHYAHLQGKKLYLTVNTLFKEREFAELYDLIRPLYLAGLDAVIVQDMGAIRWFSEQFPLLPIHVSTQATVTGYRTANYLKQYHVTRIVPARELTLSEIETLSQKTGLEIECFVHGALCYCYSGVCLFSSLASKRSGNRGRCGQPCRLPYHVFNEKGNALSKPEEPYVLSMKDLNTLSILPKIIDAGVTSLKIEGRMKKAEYAAGVTSIYRKYLDRYLVDKCFIDPVSREDEQHLFYLFNRQGFTSGYYEQTNGQDMIALREKEFRKEEEAFVCEIREKFIEKERKVPIQMSYEFLEGKPFLVSATVSYGTHDYSVECVSDSPVMPEKARSSAVSKEDLEQRLLKTGNTVFTVSRIMGNMEENLFLPLGIVAETRRKALDALSEKVKDSFSRTWF